MNFFRKLFSLFCDFKIDAMVFHPSHLFNSRFIASPYRPGKEVKTEPVETFTLGVTRPIASESQFLETPPIKLVILGSSSPSILALQSILGIKFLMIFALVKLETSQRFFFFKLLGEAVFPSFLAKLNSLGYANSALRQGYVLALWYALAS